MLQFTGLVIDNFGPFKGTQSLDFTDSDGVTIIWDDIATKEIAYFQIFLLSSFELSDYSLTSRNIVVFVHIHFLPILHMKFKMLIILWFVIITHNYSFPAQNACCSIPLGCNLHSKNAFCTLMGIDTNR